MLIVDVDIHHVRGGIEREIPYELDDHRASDIVPRVSHEVLQKGKLFGRELDFQAGALHQPLYPVQPEVAHAQHRFRRKVAAPDQGADASREFTERKRLGEIIVSAGVQALHSILYLCALGQDQYRQAWLFHPQMSQHSYAVKPRQIQIENHNVILGLGGCR